jgi:hypothetical protein
MLVMRSLTALAIAAATTTMTIAMTIFGRNATTRVRRSLTGFGPNTLKAITSAVRNTA